MGAVSKHWSVFCLLSSERVLIVSKGISTKRTSRSVENIELISVEPYCKDEIENSMPDAAKNAVRKI